MSDETFKALVEENMDNLNYINIDELDNGEKFDPDYNEDFED